MKIKNYVSALCVIALTGVSYAQDENDAYRYSNIGFNGTARYNGMAGAFGALGGDISSLVSNPAGMARFTKSEFNMGLAYENISTSTSFLNNTSPDGKGNFNIGHMGLVGAKKLEGSDWRYMQFGAAYNRTNYFHTSVTLNGMNNTSSMLDAFRYKANGYAPSDLQNYFPNTSDLAYQAYLIDPIDTSGAATDYTDRIPPGLTVEQTRNITQYGYMGEFSMSFSGNYKDKLYLGGTLGLPGTRFEKDFVHTEKVVDPDSLTSLNSFSYTETYNSRGVGYNVKLGAIFLPFDWLRLGGAIHTPTRMSFNDTWNDRMQSQFDNASYDVNGPLSSYSWRLKTPLRLIGSLGFIINKMAAIDVDVEQVNYNSMRLRRDWSDRTGYDFSNENKTIASNYKTVTNIRVGGEVKLKTYYLRAGYAYYPTPYKNGLTVSNGSMRIVSGGLGYRNKGFNVDLGVNVTRRSEDYYPYDPVLFSNNPAIINTSIVRTSVTVGWRF